MEKTQIKNLLSLVLCIVLIAAVALMSSGCNDDVKPGDESSIAVSTETENAVTKLGEGSTKFNFIVVDLDGKETAFEISTDKQTVGEALLDVKLIAGEDSAYGLYVKTVNGITLDYDTDGKYWAFYVNGEYAVSGVDTTEIKSEDSYCFKAE